MVKTIGFMRRLGCLLAASAMLAGCGQGGAGAAQGAQGGEAERQTESEEAAYGAEAIRYEVDPETFSLSAGREGEMALVSRPSVRRRVEGLSMEDGGTSWEYPDDRVSVSVRPEKDYLQVTITSTAEEDNVFSWPNVEGQTYYLPLGEGKRVPAADPAWGDYLGGGEVSVMEELSMPFWAASDGERSVLVILEDPYRSRLEFKEGRPLRFSLSHEYPAMDGQKESRFRIYLTEDGPVPAAKAYRSYVKEQGRFVTLEEKAEQNPNIRKLYGAPHVYLWGDNLIGPEDIRWQALLKGLGTPMVAYLRGFAPVVEDGEEALAVWEALSGQDYVDRYQKRVLCRFLSEALKRDDFYKPEAFASSALDGTARGLIGKGVDTLDEAERIRLNKHLLASLLPNAFAPVEEWMDRDTVGLLEDMKASGIGNAWIGLHGWEQAYAKPELVGAAVGQGYLAGTYDSYHSIHEPGKEKWSTAAFPDTSLYEEAAVTGKDGEKIKGFRDEGRKLNPTLALPAVKERVGKILSTGIPFNSWFVDCDATGEIYDDYTPGRETTQEQDLKARLERLAYIRDQHGMIVGSEGGNDYAAADIAFAHGIELKSFSWMDKDMKGNPESEYYIGRYYSPTGGVAEHFSKRIPIKETYRTLFLDPRYDAPLFKLVYHDSVITTYHWDWPTFKIKGAVQDRMVREVLYDVPPLYHLDGEEWERYKEDILAHNWSWSRFSAQAAAREMTAFRYLDGEGMVQMTEFGDGLSAVANFRDEPYAHEGVEIPGHSVLMELEGKWEVYTPRLSEGNR